MAKNEWKNGGKIESMKTEVLYFLKNYVYACNPFKNVSENEKSTSHSLRNSPQY